MIGVKKKKQLRSHPSRGAWIEIEMPQTYAGLLNRRTPRGVRGLKSVYNGPPCSVFPSHPSRGAWIEMFMPGPPGIRSNGRTPRGVRGLK